MIWQIDKNGQRNILKEIFWKMSSTPKTKKNCLKIEKLM